MIRSCDRIFIGGLFFLLVFTPFVFGAVELWAYSTVEVVIFGLVIVWMIKLTAIRARRSEFGGQRSAVTSRVSDHLAPLATPLALFIALCIFQLIPLPPGLLRAISPQTYEVYRQTLPGWPEKIPYSDLPVAIEVGEQKSEVGDQKSGGSSSRFALSSLLPVPEIWRPLSISAGLTKIDLLKFAAFAALFFLVWRYPFGEPFDFEIGDSNPGFFVLSPEQRFLRSLFVAILATGLLVAAVGFIERFTWNSKLLWFVPYDWGEPLPNGIPRASGPFVNPDHFANYLSLVFPLALGCALFRTFMVSKTQQYGYRIFCGFTAFLLFTGILLSLSRGGWISVLVGVVILAWLAPGGGRRSETRGHQSAPGSMLHASGAPHASGFTSHRLVRVARLSLISVCVLLIVSLFFAGAGGREQVDARLEETLVKDLGLAGRVDVWRESLPMIYDFPVFGVGLGAWPDLFRRYESGPWTSDYYNEAHNDYIELLTETGVIGFGFLAWFFVAVGKRLVRGIDKLPSKYVPLLAGILAALGGMALHSWLDFSLQVTANAFLFTMLLALGLRVAKSREYGAATSMERGAQWPGRGQTPDIIPEFQEVGDQKSEVGGQQSDTSQEQAVPSRSMLHALSFMRVVAVVLAAALIVCAVIQEEEPKRPESIAEARERLLTRPFKASYHLSLIRRVGDEAPLDWQLREYNAGLWIQPNNPYIRDKYAATLMAMGRPEERLKEISRSVAQSPSFKMHDYLGAESLPTLSAEERGAVEVGFRQALARGYPEAFNSLVEFYAKLERFTDQAALYEDAAQKESVKAKKAEYLLNAGRSYVRAEDDEKAEALFRKMIVAAPEDPKGYHYLATAVYALRKDLDRAKEIIAEGVKNGAPPLSLYLSLAEAAHRAGDQDAGRAALDAAKNVIRKAANNGEDPYALYLVLADGARSAGERQEEIAAVAAALDRRPRSAETLSRLGNLYLSQRNFDRAALYFARITNINPNAADAYFHLALAEEGRYRYADAGKAFARALELAPDNKEFRRRYEQLRENVENNRIKVGLDGGGPRTGDGRR